MVHILKGPMEQLQERVDVLEKQNATLIGVVTRMRMALVAEKIDLLLDAGETEQDAKAVACEWMGIDPRQIDFVREGDLQ